MRGILDQPETTMTAVTTFVDGIRTSYCELPPHFMSLEVGKTLHHWLQCREAGNVAVEDLGEDANLVASGATAVQATIDPRSRCL